MVRSRQPVGEDQIGASQQECDLFFLPLGLEGPSQPWSKGRGEANNFRPAGIHLAHQLQIMQA